MTANENVQRTVRQVSVVIETTGMTRTEHDKRVMWAEKNVTDANRYMEDAFVATVIYDENDHVVAFQGGGRMTAVSDETDQAISLLVGDQQD